MLAKSALLLSPYDVVSAACENVSPEPFGNLHVNDSIRTHVSHVNTAQMNVEFTVHPPHPGANKGKVRG